MSQVDRLRLAEEELRVQLLAAASRRAELEANPMGNGEDRTIVTDPHIIALHAFTTFAPGIAFAVADWLADEAAKGAERERQGKPYFHPLPALAVADAVLGSEEVAS